MLIVPHGYGFFTPEARADCALGSGFFARGGDFGCGIIVEDIGLWHGGILRFVVMANGARMRTNASYARAKAETITICRIAHVRPACVDCVNITKSS